MARSIWLTRRALTLHLVVVVLVPAFLGLGWWQLHRALSGNSLSWAYTFEWPIFAAYAVFLWWKLVHDNDTAEGVEGSQTAMAGEAVPRRSPITEEIARRIEEEQDPELAAYNEYLTALSESGRRKRW